MRGAILGNKIVLSVKPGFIEISIGKALCNLQTNRANSAPFRDICLSYTSLMVNLMSYKDDPKVVEELNWRLQVSWLLVYVQEIPLLGKARLFMVIPVRSGAFLDE